MKSKISNKESLTTSIKKKAAELGFDLCGISKVNELIEESRKLSNWLNNKMHGEMNYMQNNLDKRTNPKKLVTNAKSVISVLYNYYPSELLPEKSNYKISKYAYGEDYHFVIKKKLRELLNYIKKQADIRYARIFVDSAPVMDKVWALKSGLGWIGKNTCLINKKMGSFFFIGEIITDLELEYNREIQKDLCGKCTKCIDACPTGALAKPYVLDARKCISYLTIEYKGKLPNKLKSKFDNRIFGCDICQDVCPWNKFSFPHNEPAFIPSKELINMNKDKWEQLTLKKFNNLFKKSAIKRTNYEGLMRNIKFSQK